jgi:ATP-dependent helicase HrpB
MPNALPIDAVLPEVVARLRESRSLVLVAPPGAGKTTRVPPAILRADLLSTQHPNLGRLQPRRVAARASAERIASESGWTLGEQVGYHVRFDKRLGPATRIRVLTEGILTRQLLSDPFHDGVGAVLLDEFHERSLHTDVAVALLREVQQTVREELMLVIMSATLEAEPASKFLGNCPVVRAEGRTFPIEIEFHGAGGGVKTSTSDRVADAVTQEIERANGDVLAFLPGAEEIRRTMNRLESVAARDDLLVLPLHGSLPADEQTRALRPATQRKVILATNIAETSLTIDGVTTVVDAGFARVAGYDARRGLDRLELKRISKASATQRAGRAGRTGPGRCIRLWSEKEHAALADFELPEVKRVDLAGTVLALHAWGKPDPRAFGWYEPPDEPTLAAAERLLAMLGALTGESNGRITPLGERMMSLPVHPRLARLLIDAASHGMLREGVTIAAMLSEKDIARSESRQANVQGDSDLVMRMQMLEEAERSRFAAYLRDRGIDPIAARQVCKTRDELLRLGKRIAPSPAYSGEREQELMLKLPLLAYPDRVCRRRSSDPKAGVMVGGGGVRLAPESCVWQSEFFVALDARHDERNPRSEAVVRIASALEPGWLEELFPQSMRRVESAAFDESRGKVVGLRQTFYRDLLIEETKDAAVDPAHAATALAAALRPRAREIFLADDSAANVLARIALLRTHMPEHAWPTFDDEQLAELLAGASQGKRGVDELRRGALAPLLLSRLPYPLDRLLEQHAPQSLQVPTGNRIALNYSAGEKPVLAVRLQELFGMIDTPRVAGGRVAVVLHLLGPNYRPVQITEDLRSFWSSTYFQVRKDLRVRYPKHSWPEDPLTAKPEAKGGRRRS